MGGNPFECDIFCDTAVASVADGERFSFRELAGMDHHRHIDTVKVSAMDEFNFSAEIFDDALFS